MLAGQEGPRPGEPEPEGAGYVRSNDGQGRHTLTCPHGHTTSIYTVAKDEQRRPVKTFVFERKTCEACPLFERCVQSHRHGRSIVLNYHEALLQTARQRQATKECSRILKPGGILVLAVPNMGSLQARVSGKGWFHLDPPFHLYHYSASNMKKLLEKNGFEVLKVRHFSFEYNPYGFVQSIYNRMGFKANLLYDFLRSRAPKDARSKASLAFTFASLPIVAALSMGLALTEAAFRAGGTIEVYARKKAGN